MKRRVWLWVVVALLGTFGVLALGSYLYVSRSFTARREAQVATLTRSFATHDEALRADQTWAATVGLFAERPARPDADAGVFLNPRIAWGGRDEVLSAFAKAHPSPDNCLELPKPVADALVAGPWPETLTAEVVATADTRFMTELAAFDTWDIEHLSPIEDQNEGDVSTVPLPAFIPFLKWAKVRLAQGLATGTLDAAVRDTRALARLCYTTESLLGGMVGIAILGLEAELARTLAGLGQSVPADLWAPGDVARLKRVMFATPAYALRDVPDGYRDAFASFRFGRCAALNETLGAEAWIIRPLLEDSEPEAYVRLGGLLAGATECRLARLRGLWSNPEGARTRLDSDAVWCSVASPLGEDGAAADCRLGWSIRHLPGAQRLVGGLLSSIATADWFRYYEKP